MTDQQIGGTVIVTDGPVTVLNSTGQVTTRTPGHLVPHAGVPGTITPAGAVSDQDGRTIMVHQDHDGVRIDSGDVRIMLTQAGAVVLCAALSRARAIAHIWQVEQDDD